MKTILISKQVHSGFSTTSSSDVWLKVFTDKNSIDFTPVIGEAVISKIFPFLNGEIVEEVSGDAKFQSIYLKADETFYKKALQSGKSVFSQNFSDKPEFSELIFKYTNKGWKVEEKGEINPEQQAYWQRQEDKASAKAKKAGLVLWMKYDDIKKAPITVYQGGFSDEVFNSKPMQEYLASRSVFGWIGNYGTRRAEHDKLIEVGLRERGLSAEAMHNWISSSDGRHFAEGIADIPLDEQITEIKKNLNRIFNLCLIYGSSQHEGTMNSTHQIRADYEAQGILLPEDEQTYDPMGYIKIMSLFFAKTTGSLPAHINTILPGIVDEIKKNKKKK